jgi:hypothetical protein
MFWKTPSQRFSAVLQVRLRLTAEFGKLFRG